jgi:outer membrane receptor protein involved in Fe transport
MNTNKYKMILSKKSLLSSMIAVALTSTTGFAAQDDQKVEDDGKLERIVVTSQKRVQSLKDVPLSVSVMNGEKLQDAGIERIEDFSTYIPNFSVTKDPIGDKINIRGMQSGNQAGFEQSVGTFVNGVYRGRGTQARFAFADVDRVEVMRGPQSILFGKNTVAGALNITTARPEEDLAGKLSFAYTPEFEQSDIQGMITGSLTDTVRARLFVQSKTMDKGWVENTYYDTNDPASEEVFGRATVEWDISSNTLITFMAEKSDFDFNSFPHALKEAGPLAALGAFASSTSTKIGNASSDMDFGASQKMSGESSEFLISSETTLEAGTINVIAAHSAYDFERFLDADYSPLDGLRFDDTEDFTQNSLEIRFTSNPSDTFEYMSGVYFQKQEMTVDGLTFFNIPALQPVLQGGCAGGIAAFGGDFDSIYTPNQPVQTAINAYVQLPGAPAALLNVCGSAAAFDGLPVGVGRYARLEQETETYSIFAQGTWHITDDLSATAGVRYTQEEKSAYKSTYATDVKEGNTTETSSPLVKAVSEGLGEFDSHSFTPSDPGMTFKENSPTYSLNVQYDISDDTMAYMSVATGFKSGGFNSFYMKSPTNGNVAVSDDVRFDDEEVISYEIGFKTSLFDGAADLNVAAFNSTFDDMQVAIFSGNTTFEVQNAAKATSRGIEADLRWRATDSITINAALGLLDFSYDNFKNQACTSNQFVSTREANYQAAGTVPDKLGVVFGYNNALCAADHVNDLTGKSPANAPEVSASLTASHYLELGEYELQTNIDVNYNSETYRQDDLDPISLESAKTFVNAALIFAPLEGNWQLALQGKNITDTEHFAYVNDVPLFAGAHNFLPAPGRSFTVKFSYMFE